MKRLEVVLKKTEKKVIEKDHKSKVTYKYFFDTKEEPNIKITIASPELIEKLTVNKYYLLTLEDKDIEK